MNGFFFSPSYNMKNKFELLQQTARISFHAFFHWKLENWLPHEFYIKIQFVPHSKHTASLLDEPNG